MLLILWTRKGEGISWAALNWKEVEVPCSMLSNTERTLSDPTGPGKRVGILSVLGSTLHTQMSNRGYGLSASVSLRKLFFLIRKQFSSLKDHS